MTVPAVEGWFSADPEPHLIGTRCTTCGTSFFPPETNFCRNPGCSGEALVPTPLSRRGTIWSVTVNHFDPPPPGVVTAPYGVAAVELAAEQIVVLGLVDGDASTLKVGSEVELVVAPLTDETTVWKWRAL